MGFDGSYGRVAAFVRGWRAQRQIKQQTSGRGTFVPFLSAAIPAHAQPFRAAARTGGLDYVGTYVCVQGLTDLDLNILPTPNAVSRRQIAMRLAANRR